MTKKSIKEFSSGKIEDPEIKKAKDLEALLSDKFMNPFGTLSYAKFEEKLKDSTLSDLQHLCEKVGIFPSHEKDRLKDQLRKEFKRFSSPSYSYTVTSDNDISNPNHPNHEKAKKLLNLGM